MTYTTQIKIIEQFNKTSVLVIGDLMLDRYLIGSMSRISPEAPAPLISINSENFNLGGAANAIHNIHTFGGNVLVGGAVGDDWFGKKLIGQLKRDHIDISGIIELKDRPTTVKTRVVAEQQQIIRLDRECTVPVSESDTQKILKFIERNIEKVDVILISDYHKGVVTYNLLKGTIDLAKKFQKPVIVYPKIGHFLNYSGTTVVLTNLEQASLITGIRQINETSIRNMGHWLLTHLECEFVLLSHEKDGFTLFEKDGNVTHIPFIINNMRNVTGTLDAVACIITLSLASDHANMKEAVHLANIAASIVFEKRNIVSSLVKVDDFKQRLKCRKKLQPH